MSELFKWVCAHFRAIPSLREHVSRAIMAELCKAAMKGCAICLLFETGDTLFFNFALGRRLLWKQLMLQQ